MIDIFVKLPFSSGNATKCISMYSGGAEAEWQGVEGSGKEAGREIGREGAQQIEQHIALEAVLAYANMCKMRLYLCRIATCHLLWHAAT